jgi:hypothetical protein
MAFAELEVPSGTPDLPSFDPLDDPSDTKLRFIAGDSEVIWKCLRKTKTRC